MRGCHAALHNPPPASEAALARELGVNRSNLHRRAPQFGVDVGGLFARARARWALARIRSREDVPEPVSAMGIADDRPLEHLLLATAGCARQRACTFDLETMIGPILVALGRATEVAHTG